MRSGFGGILAGGFAFAASTLPAGATSVVTVAPAIPHPSQSITITGTGFGASEAIDVYLDTTDSALVVSASTGKFSTTLTVAATVSPGEHYVTAIGRRSGDAAQLPFTVSTPWAEFGYGRAHAGLNPYENTINTSNVGSLGLLWSSKSSPVIAGPTISGGRLFTAGSTGIEALAVGSGRVLWNAYKTTGFYGTPAVANNIVYAGSISSSVFYAVNAATGAQIWARTLGSTTRGSPVVVGNIVYIGCNDDKLYALNATTGAVIWSYTTGGAVDSSPAVTDGVVYFGSLDDKVYALDSLKGTLIWSYTTGGTVYASPVVANGVVYIGSYDGKFYALAATTGDLIWSATTNEPIYGAAAAVANRVIVGSEDDYVREFNARTGALIWSVDTGAEVDGSPSIANGVVYIGTSDGTLLALDILYGQVLQSMVSKPYVTAAPAISDGVVYFNGELNRTYAYALQAGTEQVRAPDIRTLTRHRNLALKVAPTTSPAAIPGATALDP